MTPSRPRHNGFITVKTPSHKDFNVEVQADREKPTVKVTAKEGHYQDLLSILAFVSCAVKILQFPKRH